MAIIFPLSSQYLVTHNDLVKFGVDNPQNIKTKFDKSIKQNKKQKNKKDHQSNFTPQIIYSGIEENIIIIQRVTYKNQYYEVKVNKENGYFIEYTKGFADILKFDQTTFVNKNNLKLENVGYWDRFNRYISPINK